MECTLMNKNTPVVSLNLDEDTAVITKVIKPRQIAWLPVGIWCHDGIPDKAALNAWWYGRAIPASRSGLREALAHMDVTHSEQLLTKCYGLSLSDQYWMCPKGSGLTWENVNFFENNFSDDVGNILFGQPPQSQIINMMSPCNTSDGWLKKKWKVIEGKRCLIKAGSRPYLQEPLNEVIATKLHQRLGNENYVAYSLLWEKDQPYSVCEDFIHADIELVNGISINRSIKKRSQNSAYHHFVVACDTLGIPGMKEYLTYLLVFDYLMGNTDRHFGNLGAIRDVNTLQWLGPAPVFDSGTSLWHDKLTKSIQGSTPLEVEPFYPQEWKQLALITDFTWLDFERLAGFPDDIQAVLAASPYMEKTRIAAITDAVKWRMERLREKWHEQ